MVDLPDRNPLEALKAAADAGDRMSEERLVGVLGEMARRYLQRRLGARVQVADLEDVAQEICLRLSRSIKSCRADSAPQLIAWVREIAANCIHDHYRTRRLVGGVLPEWLPDPRSQGHDTAASPPSPLMKIVAEVEAALPADHQRLLYLRLMEGLTWREVGADLGINENAAKRRWQRLQARIKKQVLEQVTNLPDGEKKAVLEELEERNRG